MTTYDPNETRSLAADEADLVSAYLRLQEAQTFSWRDNELPLTALPRLLDEGTRPRRERAWRLVMDRRQVNAPAIQRLWASLLHIRRRQAADVGCNDYRSYRWQRLDRRDYQYAGSPALHTAVEEWVMPVLLRLHEARRLELGVRRLRPWDLAIDPTGRAPLRPFPTPDAARLGVAHLLTILSPSWENLPVSATIEPGPPGEAADVPALLWQAAQALTSIAAHPHPGLLHDPDPESAALIATLLELLALRHYGDAGTFYSQEDAPRARRQHLEGILFRWARAAMLDAFEQWAYADPVAAADPRRCSQQWVALWLRFLPTVDWTDLEDYATADWQCQVPLFHSPCTASAEIVGGVAAVHIWAKQSESTAVDHLRELMSLAGSQPPRGLLAITGGRITLDEHTLREAVDHIENEMIQVTGAIPPRTGA